jgi:hypothetical protein
LSYLLPDLSDFQVPIPIRAGVKQGGRKARPYEILLNLLGRGLDRRFIPARTERAIVPTFILGSLNLAIILIYFFDCKSAD